MDDRERTDNSLRYGTQPTPMRRMHGETLTRLRQQAGLRQADVNKAMADWGWNHMSCARLEGAYTFDLSVEEMGCLCAIVGAKPSEDSQSRE